MRIYEENRGKYKTTYKSKGCDFCDAIVLKDQEVKQLQGEFWRVLACKYPYMDGNLMIIPKRHVEDIDQLNKDEWAEFGEMLIKTKKLLSDLFSKTKSFNIALQVGPNSGATMKHIHWMIIPRPKLESASGWNIFQNFYFVTMSYKDLIKKINQFYKRKK